MEGKFNCSYKELIEIDSPKLIPHPNNPNIHPEKQIERLAKIIEYQGQRSPIVISTRSGFITKGHGRFEAIKKLGWSKIAVDFQDYDNEAQEYADITADNAIATWAELDKNLVMEQSSILEIDFDFLGLPEIKILEPEDYEDKNKELDTENFGNDLQHTCPKCSFEFND